MPLDRFVLILVVVIAAAAATVFVATSIMATADMPALGLWLLIPLGLVVYVCVRVIGDRMRSSDDSHYDRIEK